MRIAILIVAAFFVGLFCGVVAVGWRGAGRAAPSTNVEAVREASSAPSTAPEHRAAPGTRAPRGRIDAAPSASPAAGTGSITGSVRTEDGQPIAGVLVATAPSSFGRYAAGEASRAQATSDEKGAFEIHGLADATYVLTATLDGFEVVPAGNPAGKQERLEARPGEEVHFVARPVVAIEARVLLADGTEAKSAKVKATRALRRNRSTRTFDWTPADPMLRLPPGEYSIAASLGADDELSSERVEVSLRRGSEGSSITLQLEMRSGIRGRVILPPGEEMATSVFVFRTDSDAPPDPTDLKSKGKTQETDADQGFRFLFRDLSPGRYMVAATRTAGRVEAFVAVDVASGFTNQDVQLGAMDSNDGIEVWVFGPDGQPIADVLFQDRCNRSPEQRAGTRSGTVGGDASAARRPDGSYLVSCFGSDACGYAERVSRRTLEVETARYGKQKVDYELPRTEPIVVRFEDRATLDVAVAGYKGSGHEGYVSVGVESGPARNLDAEGHARLGPVNPGDAQLYFRLEQASGGRSYGVVMPALKVRLRPGPNKVEVALPPVRSLTLLVDESGRTSSLTLMPLDEDGAPTGFPCGVRAVREDGNVVFDRLPPGRYTVYDGNRHRGGAMIVEIPGSDVLRFEPRPRNTLLIKIDDAEGRLAQAGLRTGDRIIGIDDLLFEDEEFLGVQLNAAKLRESVKLTVLRGSEQLEIPYSFKTDGNSRRDGGDLFSMPR